ncbi:hypothetical protein FN846DRAFT_911355 [Sphaerosporella brunnea]|uniref:Uncharacterized protein n=1 Tax=Sphaerosporella brunnea TaxID=1250544 RepID=A0A5J5EKQ7_9PEZI|nr:hypothetical protein FN846DRAFT_911355 [Sphaerosporella brunnea]
MSAPTTRQTRSTRSTPASDGNTAAPSSAAATAHQLSTEMEGSATAPTTNTTTDNPAPNNIMQALLAAFSPEERERALVRLLAPGDHGSASVPSASDLEEPPADSSLQRDPPEDWYVDVGPPRITARYLWWGLCANTRRTYATARNSYRPFADFSGLDSPFPVTVESLCNWMAYLGNRRRTKSATMKSYLTGLRSYCVDMGMDDLDVFCHPRVQRVIRGIKIFHGARESDRRERLPITRDLLLHILTRLDSNTQEGTTNHAASSRNTRSPATVRCSPSRALPPIPPLRVPRSSTGSEKLCWSLESQATIPVTPSGGAPQHGPALLAFRTPTYSYWAAGNQTLTNATSKFTLNTSTTSLAACRPCHPPRATSRQPPARARAWGVWEELSAASLPHPGKTQAEQKDRVEKEGRGRMEKEGRGRMQMEDGDGKVVLCLPALACLSATALTLYWFQRAFVGSGFADAIVAS